MLHAFNIDEVDQKDESNETLHQKRLWPAGKPTLNQPGVTDRQTCLFLWRLNPCRVCVICQIRPYVACLILRFTPARASLIPRCICIFAEITVRWLLQTDRSVGVSFRPVKLKNHLRMPAQQPICLFNGKKTTHPHNTSSSTPDHPESCATPQSHLLKISESMALMNETNEDRSIRCIWVLKIVTQCHLSEGFHSVAGQERSSLTERFTHTFQGFMQGNSTAKPSRDVSSCQCRDCHHNRFHQASAIHLQTATVSGVQMAAATANSITIIGLFYLWTNHRRSCPVTPPPFVWW